MRKHSRGLDEYPLDKKEVVVTDDSIASPPDTPDVDTLNAAYRKLIDQIEHGSPSKFIDRTLALAVAEWLHGEALGLSALPAWVELHQAVIGQLAAEDGRDYVRLKVMRDERGRVQYTASTIDPALRVARCILGADV